MAQGRTVVCGAGAAGMAAAIAIARAGCKPLLIEKRSATGGSVSHCLIHTLGGLYDSEGRLLQEGLPAELVQRLKSADRRTHARKIGRTWTLNVDPASYEQTTSRWLKEERVEVWLGAEIIAAQIEDSCVSALHVRCADGRLTWLSCSAFIDCTGGAEVVRLAAPEKVIYGERRAAAGLIFQLCNVERKAIAFPRNLEVLQRLRKAAQAGTLPALCEKIWVDLGVRDNDAYFKLFVPLPPGWRDDPLELVRAEQEALRCREILVEFMHNVSGFTQVSLGATGRLGIRDGARIVGQYVLSAADVRSARKFSSAACKCAWPIEYWDPEKGVSVEYLSAGDYYEIPREALRVGGLDNGWAAGKCFSADPLARASARVVGCCWGMGEAAALGAASYIGLEA